MLMNIVDKLMNQKKDGVNANFEDVQTYIRTCGGPRGGGRMSEFVLISTLGESEQHCLIRQTYSVEDERDIITKHLKNTRDLKILIYGKNAADVSVDKKLKQLRDLGFSHVYVYKGGLFEWLLLQDIYGADEFPTTCQELDLIKYRNPSIF